MRIMLAKGVDEEGDAKVITVEGTDREDPSMEGVKLFYDLRHRNTRTEASVESFSDQGDLGVSAEVLMAFAKGYAGL